MSRFRTLRRALPALCLGIGSVAACADADFELTPLEDGGVNVEAGGSSSGDASRPTPTKDAGPDATVQPARCGDGNIDPGESCDDGNEQDGDGCTAACALESAGPRDLCVGEAVELAANDGSTTTFSVTVDGETTTLFNQYQGTCGGGSSADAVFRFVPPALGRASVRVVADFPVVVSARSACDTDTSELACSGNAPPAPLDTPAVIGFPVVALQPTYVFVDGYGGSKGTFRLEVTVDTAVCGNGIGEQPEACDDGNLIGGDGCSATCGVEDAATPGTCPGMGFRLAAAPGADGVLGFSGDTLTPAAASNKPTANACPANNGSNRIYAITPTVGGNLTFDLMAGYEGALLHVHRSCIDAGDLADCRGAEVALTPLRVSIPVRAEETVYAVVDSGVASTGGLYALQAKLVAASCGNGALDDTEECDDGNQTDGDGCSAACVVERSVASYTCPGQVVTVSAATPAHMWGTTRALPAESTPANKFAIPSCGSTAPDVVYQLTSDVSGYVTARLDASFPASLALKSACTLGNGTVDRIACAHERTGTAERVLAAPIVAGTPLFLVVDGYATAYAGTFELDVSVVPSVCGNAVVEGGETCDDGNLDADDACSATCQIEPKPSWGTCATAPELVVQDVNGIPTARAHSGNANLDHTKADPAVTGSNGTLTCTSVGADAWYRVTAPATGTLVARIPKANFDSVIGVRKSCLPDPTRADQLACEGSTAANGGQRVAVPVVGGESYVIVVDSRVLAERGIYDVEVQFLPEGCGDTVVTAGEQCDDGNTQDGDGCSSACQLAALPGIDTCPGAPLSLQGVGSDVRRAVLTVDTATLTAQTAGTCGGSGKDATVRLRSDLGGILEVRATRDAVSFTPVLYTREVCIDPASEFQCKQGSAPVLSMPVVANQDYFLFLDGLAGQAGIAQVDITVTP